ncbi:hypothetical protein AGLY_010852, partial [Aphis glycines]
AALRKRRPHARAAPRYRVVALHPARAVSTRRRRSERISHCGARVVLCSFVSCSPHQTRAHRCIVRTHVSVLSVFFSVFLVAVRRFLVEYPSPTASRLITLPAISSQTLSTAAAVTATRRQTTLTSILATVIHFNSTTHFAPLIRIRKNISTIYSAVKLQLDIYFHYTFDDLRISRTYNCIHFVKKEMINLYTLYSLYKYSLYFKKFRLL